VTFGDNPNVMTNTPFCTECINMMNGGWCNCASPITGTVFGVDSNYAIVSFIEVMAYTQKALQINTGVTVTSIGTE
jgi:hypothetical protein